MARKPDFISQKNPWRQRISPLTVAGWLLIIYLGVLVIQTVKHNYDLRRQIGVLQNQITVLEEEQQELSYRIQYYKTEAFVERQARAKLGLKDPGENVLVLPKESAAGGEAAEQKDVEKPKSNIKQWLEFLFG